MNKTMSLSRFSKLFWKTSINELKNVKFKGKLKLMFIISDGEIYDNTQAEATLNELRKQSMEVIKYAIGN